MTKTDTARQLNQAKSAHLQWVQRAYMLMFGFEFEKDSVPIDSTQCVFGKWLYGECQALCHINDPIKDLIADIERLHLQLHNSYFEIFKIYFGEQKKGFLRGLFKTKKKSLNEDEVKIANEHYRNLENISEHLIKKLTSLQKKIHNTRRTNR
ncbi:MAG: CZB domain-containing protein [Sulfurovaceae bacterium]|nr:CZB domain-containing protein [Sulfurovaceae bacterium]